MQRIPPTFLWGANNGYNDNKWHHIVGTFTSTTCITYIDGNEVARDTAGLQNLTVATYNMSVFGTSAATTNYALGNLAVFRAYRKTLSYEEILQNYNALKGRFGL